MILEDYHEYEKHAKLLTELHATPKEKLQNNKLANTFNANYKVKFHLIFNNLKKKIASFFITTYLIIIFHSFFLF